jgi:hypothetical protein
MGGAIQKEFYRSNCNYIWLDFSELLWADPLPLLGLGCEIHRFARHENNVVIDLGRPRPNHENHFLTFFVAQGFAQQIMPHADFRWNGKQIRSADELETIVRQLDFSPLYQNADCIKAKIFSISRLDSHALPILVEQIIEEADQLRIDRWLAMQPRSRDFLLQSMRIIITETLDNIADHAYHATTHQFAFGGLYARIRAGQPDNEHELMHWRKARAAEREHCPTLTRNNCGKQPGWLELFVCDVGCGITTGLATNDKAPLRELTNHLFMSPISRISNRLAERRTEVTGLKHIGDVLRRGAEEHGRTGFVRVYSNGEWAGEHLPWPAPENEASYRNFRRTAACEPFQGTMLHFAVEPVDGDPFDQRRVFPTFFFIPTIGDLAEVRASLSQTGPVLFAPPHKFVDLQTTVEIGHDPPGRGAIAIDWMKEVNASTAIIRPSRSIRKNDFIYQLSNIGHATSGEINRLVFADLPASVAIDLGHLLHDERLWQPWPYNELTVYLLSQDWSCSAFRLNHDKITFTSDLEAARSFIRDAQPAKRGASLVASVLRERDSTLFWSNIGDGYLNEIIKWRSSSSHEPANELEIVGYLDLPIALANERCYRIARRAMRRAVTSFAHYETLTADELIRPLIDRAFAVNDGARSLGERQQPVPVVLVGSVVITGSTIVRFGKRTDISVIGTVHLVAHPHSTRKIAPGQEVLALHWTPPVAEPRRASKQYERIPGTSHIIRGGDLAITLPRFAAPTGTGTACGPSLYGEDPNTAYTFWQRRRLLRFGHWIYGLHHELLTVSLADAVRSDFSGERRIVQWVIQVLGRFSKEATRLGVPYMVIYPRHEVTDYLMRSVSADMGDLLPLSALAFG